MSTCNKENLSACYVFWDLQRYYAVSDYLLQLVCAALFKN